MNNEKMKEIENLINREFDSRMEAAVFSNILDKGMCYLSNVTEEEINSIDGNGLMTAKFTQALVKVSVLICKKYTPMEIMEYIRMRCNFSPFIKNVTFYREYFTNDGWSYICEMSDRDEDEEFVELCIIID